ncbi:MAG: FHA domain-containing protein [Melioribacteraceae bacterium]
MEIIINIEHGKCSKKQFVFKNSFNIGRGDECSIQFDDGIVSRKHVEFYYDNGKWWVSDLTSSNGTYINGKKITTVHLEDDVKIEIGKDGPVISVIINSEKKTEHSNKADGSSVDHYINHYFDKNQQGNEAGEHTKMIRQAFQVVQKKKSKKYKYVIVIIGILFILAGSYAVYQYNDISKQRELAENIFYDMKTMEIELSKLSNAIMTSGDKNAIETVNKIRNNHYEMGKKYDQFIDKLGIYDMDEETKIIFRMARIFGECELNIPKEFIGEVKNYIKKWQSSSRLVNSLKRAKSNGYNEIVIKKMNEYYLPIQFFYLALQESSFKAKIVGPKTRYGYAKGIWQFIYSTAIKYGLKVGPLLEKPIYDPRDERFNFVKATDAAARYLNDIYAFDAQASGLLVMASYNWGEHNVGALIHKFILEMPDNPRERNFWHLLEKHRKNFPDETYNYVFYIFSAAVICENPQLFGFDFDNPLE